MSLEGTENTTSDDAHYVLGDIVWVKTHESSPYLPACICDASTLPPLPGKFAVYIYGSEIFDYAEVNQLKKYNAAENSFEFQDVDRAIETMYWRSCQKAEREYSCTREERLKHIQSLKDSGSNVLESDSSTSPLGSYEEPQVVKPSGPIVIRKLESKESNFLWNFEGSANSLIDLFSFPNDETSNLVDKSSQSGKF